MAGPPFKWQWVDRVDITRDESNRETRVTLNWKSKQKDDGSKPEPAIGEVDVSCGDCIVWIGAGLAANNVPIGQNFVAAKQIGIPDVEDSGTVTVTLPSTRGEVHTGRSDVYNFPQWKTDWLRSNFGLDNFLDGPLPEIIDLEMPDVELSNPEDYSFTVRNTGSPGDIEVEANGQNARSISTTDRFDSGEQRRYSNVYELRIGDTKATLDITATGQQTVSKTMSASRISPKIGIREIISPGKLCEGERGDVAFRVENKGGEGYIDVDLTGQHFSNMRTSDLYGNGQVRRYETDVTMPNALSTSADITISSGEEDISDVISVSRQKPSPKLEFNIPTYATPGQDLKLDIIGRVENCSLEGLLEIIGDVDISKQGNVSPDSDLRWSPSLSMPGRSIESTVRFTAENTTEKGPNTIRPENAVLIDSEDGVGVHAPVADRIDYDMLVVAEDPQGKGGVLSDKDIASLDVPRKRVAKLFSMLPNVEPVFIDSTIEDTQSDNVLGKRILYIGGKADQEIAVCLDGEFKHMSNSWVLINPPLTGPRLMFNENEQTIG